MKRYLFIGFIILIVLWTTATVFHVVDEFFLPGPWKTIYTLFELAASGVIWNDLAATLERMGLAFAIAIFIGYPLGLFIGSSKRLYRSLEFIIDFFRSLPASALFPLFLLIFGISDISKIAIAAFTSCLIIIFNTAHGVLNSKQSRILAARIMGAGRLQIFYFILIWESLPQTLIGLRSAVSLSLIIIVLTEMFVGSTNGLGRRIIDAQITYEIPKMYAVILLTGIVGYLLNLLFVLIEGRLLHWSGK